MTATTTNFSTAQSSGDVLLMFSKTREFTKKKNYVHSCNARSPLQILIEQSMKGRGGGGGGVSKPPASQVSHGTNYSLNQLYKTVFGY